MKVKTMKQIISLVIMVMLLMTGCTTNAVNSTEENSSSANESSSTSEETTGSSELIKIGITQIVEHPALDSAKEGFIQGLNESGYEGKVEFIEKNAQGDMATAQMIAEGFVKDKVDMIYAIATPTAQAAFNVTKDIPIMISAVTDPVSAGLVLSSDNPGTNVSGTSDEAPIDLQLALLKDLGIEPKTIGFIYSTSEKNSEVQLAMLESEAEKLGMKVEALGVTSVTEIEQGMDVLLGKIDVLYTPTDNLVASAIQLVTSKALDKSIPVLGAEVAHVEGGALATCGVDYFELGRQTGIMAASVLDGDDISTMAIQKATEPETTINVKTAKELGITVSESLLNSSSLVGE